MDNGEGSRSTIQKTEEILGIKVWNRTDDATTKLQDEAISTLD